MPVWTVSAAAVGGALVVVFPPPKTEPASRPIPMMPIAGIHIAAAIDIILASRPPASCATLLPESGVEGMEENISFLLRALTSCVNCSCRPYAQRKPKT